MAYKPSEFLRMMAAPHNHDLDRRIDEAREVEHVALGRHLASPSDDTERAVINAYNDVNFAVDYRRRYYEKLTEMEADLRA
jgi:hypothetical protein